MKYYVVSDAVNTKNVTAESLRDALFENDRFYGFTDKKDAERFALDGQNPKSINQFAVYEVEFDGSKGRKATRAKLSTGEVLKKGVFVIQHEDTENFTYTIASLEHVDAKKFKKALDVAAFEENEVEADAEEENEVEADVDAEEENEVEAEADAEEENEVEADVDAEEENEAEVDPKAEKAAQAKAKAEADKAKAAADKAKVAADKAKAAAEKAKAAAEKAKTSSNKSLIERTKAALKAAADQAKATAKAAAEKAKEAAEKAKAAAAIGVEKVKDAAKSATDTASSIASTSTFKYVAGVTAAIAATSAALFYGNVVPTILATLAKSAAIAPYAAAFAAKVGVAGVAIASGAVAVAAALATAYVGYKAFNFVSSYFATQKTAKEVYQAKLEAELKQVKDLEAKLDKKDRPFVVALDKLLSKAPEAKFKADGSEAARQPKVNKEMVAAFEIEKLAKVVDLKGAARAKAEKEVLAEATKKFGIKV